MLHTHHCLEVAVYTAPLDFDTLQRSAHRDIASWPGFVTSLALRGLQQRASRCDLVLWQSQEAAHAAADAIGQDPRFAAFVGAINEIRHFAHYTPATPDALVALANVPVVEVAAYDGKPSVPLSQLRATIHELLRDRDGASPQIAGVRPDQPSSLLDVIGWAEPATQAAAQAELQTQHPELAEFFSGVDNMHVFELFEVVS